MRRPAIFGSTIPLKATLKGVGWLDYSLAAAVVLLAATHVALLIAWNPGVPAPDPDGLGNISRYLLEGLGFRNSVGDQSSAYPGPISTTILAGVFAVAGDGPLAVHAYNGTVFVGTVLLTYYAARQLARPWFAAASALLVATYVPLLGGILVLRYEGVQGFFTLAGVALTLRVLNRPRPALGGLAGAAWAGSLLVNPVGALFPFDRRAVGPDQWRSKGHGYQSLAGRSLHRAHAPVGFHRHHERAFAGPRFFAVADRRHPLGRSLQGYVCRQRLCR